MADSRAANRGTIMPDLANLMNPSEPDHRYSPDHHNARARSHQPSPQAYMSSSVAYHNNRNGSNTPSDPCSVNPQSQSNSIREHSEMFQNSTPPASHHPIKLAPLSELTASLYHSTTNPSTYASCGSGYPVARIDSSGLTGHHYPSSSYSSLQPASRGTIGGQEEFKERSYGYKDQIPSGLMGPPPFNSWHNNGWKETSMSSSSSTTSSSKSESTSPQPMNWGGKLSPKRSSEKVNGRSYAMSVDYIFPNDDKEQERLDLTHKIFLLLLNGALHWAPIGNDPKRILDIGTGTGIWVIDMAEKYPNATVIGTDVLKIQSERYPQNASFVIFDAEATWPWLEKFDFMHTRCLAGALADWEKFIAQAFHNLKPGGYIELHEYSTEVFSPDPSISPAIHAPTIFQWAQLFNQASTLSGRPPGNIITPRLKHELAAAGFVDIEERPLMLPLGVWHPERRMKELGAYGLLNMLDGVEGFTLRLFTRYLGWTDEQCKILIDKVRKEFKRGAKLYVLEYVIWARKPGVVSPVSNNNNVNRASPSHRTSYIPPQGFYHRG